MLTEPKIVERAEQQYAAIRVKLAQKDIPAILPPLIPEVMAWLSKNKIEPAGHPFFRYLSMKSMDAFLVDVGVPVRKAVKGNDRVTSNRLPGGSYVSSIYTGDYKNLMKAHKELEPMVAKKGWKAGQQKSKDGQQWETLTEIYLTDPEKEPSPEKWQTEITFLLDK